MPIRVLPPLLVNQIAAGEVIERPASVVKELVENSLDAGAQRIDVQVEDGGRTLIRVSDDGAGIAAEDLHLAVAPHATSKITRPEDLETISTMGFRGEALASIASISRLRITSRAFVDGKLADAAAVLEASGDQLSPVRPEAGAPGSIIEIRDLFFNTPARRKFLRGAPSEFGHIAETLQRIAMAHPSVAVKLTHGPRVTFDFPAGQSQRDRCLAILGTELDEGLLEFTQTAATAGADPSSSALAVWGLAGVPAIARATSKFQYLFVNGRPVRDRNLGHAIKEAYRGLMPFDRQPFVVLMIRMDPAAVDVNVHPAKSEVRFHEPQRLHGFVLAALRQRLLGADLTPTASILAAAPSPLALPDFDDSPPPPHPLAPSTPLASPPLSAPPPTAPPSIFDAPSPAPATTPVTSPSAFVEYFKRMEPSQKGFVFAQVRDAFAATDPETAATQATPRIPGAAWDRAQQNAQRDTVPAPALRAHGVLQVHKSYLVTQDEDGIVIIDQHALHERVMFEELRQRILGRNLESQRLLVPTILRAAPRRQEIVRQLQPLLERIGIEAAPMGPDTIGIHAFPTLLFERGVAVVDFMNELLDRAEEGKLDVNHVTVDEAALHEVLDMMACKAAVKAGDGMTPEELAALLARRHDIERAGACPHGRPTTIRLTLRDLERHFKRT